MLNNKLGIQIKFIKIQYENIFIGIGPINKKY